MQSSIADNGAFLPRLMVIDPAEDLFQFIYQRFYGIFQVHGARDGREGLKLAELFQPHLIVLEPALPDVDGLELCRQLRAQESERICSILILTSLNDPAIPDQTKEAGANAFLARPFRFGDLYSTLMTLALMNDSVREEWKTAQPWGRACRLEQGPQPYWLLPEEPFEKREVFPCPYCGAEIGRGDNFCLNCGQRVPEAGGNVS